MPKCTINGKEIEVKAGTTIIEAMYKEDIRIAHYCYHPGLSIAGVCRLCMVEIEGNPRVQIACNTVITEGMKINNTSEKVKDAVKWGLDFHLINHPLDCPICDQAGECGLQDQYMEYGKYDPEMAEPKQKKHKVVDLGPTVVLDSERCILCSRCVRFTDEVSKTHELGLFNRGDRTEVGTHEGVQLNNKYSLNTVDICPVGALTSKDFRFRQRVWYLKDSETICQGCSTGCNVNVYYNKEGMFRVKPRENQEVNGHWMCDEGRDIYKFVNRDSRLLKGKRRTENGWMEESAGQTAKYAGEILRRTSGEKIALVLTGQQTVEEYESIVKTFSEQFKTKNVYHWVNNKETFDQFDGLLIRGDKNPNTKGLLKVFETHGIQLSWGDLTGKLKSQGIETLVVVAPENQAVFPDMADRIAEFKQAKNLIWMSAGSNALIDQASGNIVQIPLKTFVEKDGTFVNFKGMAQSFKKATIVVSEALTLVEAAQLLSGGQLKVEHSAAGAFVDLHQRSDQVTLEHRKKNEFVYRRGSL